jgi:hypothetical protein
MKTKLTQLVSFVNKFDRRHIQILYFIMMFALAVVMKSPSDGGGGPI